MKGKIGKNEHATLFWQGIPKTLRVCLDNCLLAKNPTCDLSEPYGIEEVDTTVEAILPRDYFDTVYNDSDSEAEQSSGDESSDESDDEGDENKKNSSLHCEFPLCIHKCHCYIRR